MNGAEKYKIKPFLKWAGGKTQLLSQIQNHLPSDFFKRNTRLVEPFVGGGAVFIFMLQYFENITEVIINDSNTDLINTYKVLKRKSRALIKVLKTLQNEYNETTISEDEKKEIYGRIRTNFNYRNADIVTQSAYFIFLNKTCFNGLFRVNKSNLFNVPMGKYKQPLICDEKNIIGLSKLMKKVTILNGDYVTTQKYANKECFFYLDPPYKPLNKTSSFTSYNQSAFNDVEQQRLKLFCDKVHLLDGQWLLSNSDAYDSDGKQKYFDKLYQNYYIKRVEARRNINSKSTKRGKINEVLISNYSTD